MKTVLASRCMVLAAVCVWASLAYAVPRVELISEHESQAEGLSGFAWSPDGTRFMTWSAADGTVQICIPGRDQSVAVLRHGALVRHAEWSTDGERVVTSAIDGVARVWDTEQAELVQSIGIPERMVGIALWGGDGESVPLFSPKGF